MSNKLVSKSIKSRLRLSIVSDVNFAFQSMVNSRVYKEELNFNFYFVTLNRNPPNQVYLQIKEKQQGE